MCIITPLSPKRKSPYAVVPDAIRPAAAADCGGGAGGRAEGWAAPGRRRNYSTLELLAFI